MSILSALSEPVFKLNQDSEIYKNIKKRKDRQVEIDKLIDGIANEYGFDAKEFNYYNSNRFGFLEQSEAFEKFKDNLTKNSDRNGVFTFKKNTKCFKEISEMMKGIDEIHNLVSPFALHDVFGLNNVNRSQWIKDGYFVEVKDSKRAKLSKSATEVDYKEYLELLLQYV